MWWSGGCLVDWPISFTSENCFRCLRVAGPLRLLPSVELHGGVVFKDLDLTFGKPFLEAGPRLLCRYAYKNVFLSGQRVMSLSFFLGFLESALQSPSSVLRRQLLQDGDPVRLFDPQFFFAWGDAVFYES